MNLQSQIYTQIGSLDFHNYEGLWLDMTRTSNKEQLQRLNLDLTVWLFQGETREFRLLTKNERKSYNYLIFRRKCKS